MRQRERFQREIQERDSRKRFQKERETEREREAEGESAPPLSACCMLRVWIQRSAIAVY